jgi:hypothetical protein
VKLKAIASSGCGVKGEIAAAYFETKKTGGNEGVKRRYFRSLATVREDTAAQFRTFRRIVAESAQSARCYVPRGEKPG